jgi:glycosyltransferase involved in cell wall biosynthesis
MRIASVIIPAYGRPEKLDLSIKSVLQQSDSGLIEIIVIDDFSLIPLNPKGLRAFDKLIRNSVNSGAAVSRNKGIIKAEGDWIFLLDSDDLFILDKETLYYGDVKTNKGVVLSPESVTKDTFFSTVLYQSQGALQTSSLFFHRDNRCLFDECLPKHQDWDFVYNQFLLCNKNVKKIDNLVYFDKSDKNSISRKKSPEKSLPWLNKLEQLYVDEVWIKNLRLRFLGIDKNSSFPLLLYGLFFEVYSKRLRSLDAVKVMYKRLFYV